MLLVFALVAIDPRVRDYVGTFIGGATPAAAGRGLQDVFSVIVMAVRDQSIDHAPMMIFVVAATVLFLGMVRT